MKCADLIKIFQQQAAESYACDWDNVGLLVGRPEKEVKKVYISLDATDEAIQEAAAVGADMLLTHHPLIFHGIKRITEDNYIGRRIIALIRADISYYAMHTNFDVMGMADLAADKMGMQDTQPLEVTCMEEDRALGIGKAGNLEEEMSLADCCERVKAAFALDKVLVYGNLTQKVKRVAICPGAGKSDVAQALRAGADVYITGDIDHHTGIDANACGMAVIDAGHYGIEHIFIPYMQQYLKEHVPAVEVFVQKRSDPFQVI